LTSINTAMVKQENSSRGDVMGLIPINIYRSPRRGVGERV